MCGIRDTRRIVGKKYEMVQRKVKLCWDFEYRLRKTATARRPDVTIEYKNKNEIFLVDMACSSKSNVNANHAEKLQKYQQIAFEIRERRTGYNVMIIPIVLAAWTTDIRREENKSDIEQNGEDSTF